MILNFWLFIYILSITLHGIVLTVHFFSLALLQKPVNKHYTLELLLFAFLLSPVMLVMYVIALIITRGKPEDGFYRVADKFRRGPEDSDLRKKTDRDKSAKKLE